MSPILQILFRKMETRRLHNQDMRSLVQVLRKDPRSPADPGDARFEKATQAAIKTLPRRLHSLSMSHRSSLCRNHKGLDGHLIDDLWSWIKYELKFAVGRFLYPIVMADVLSLDDEYRVRQLEPVVRMLKTEWSLVESAAPGKRPIDAGEKWTHQENCCAACMLTRIGSDEDVLFALFACMYGRLRSRGEGQKGEQKVRSKRLRFICYWMKTHPDGRQAAEKAYELGVELKAIRRDVKATFRRSKKSVHCRLANTGHDVKTGHAPPLDPAAPIISKKWKPSDLFITPTELQQVKVNTQPSSPYYAKSVTSMSTTRTTKQRRDSGHSTTPINRSYATSSLYSDRSPSIASPPSPMLPSYAFPNSNYSRHTVASSVLSYNDPTKTPNPRGYDPLETVEEWVDRFTKPSQPRNYNFSATAAPVEWTKNNPDDAQSNAYLAKYRPAMGVQPVDAKAQRRQAVLLDGTVVGYKGQVLPKPHRCSIYSVFGEEDGVGDEFEHVDQAAPTNSSIYEP